MKTIKVRKESMRLYAVTDRSWLNGRTLEELIEEALKGGVSFLQLREKKLDYESFCKEAFEIKKLCRKYDVPFIINDNIDIALKVDADGVHIGQDDMNISEVRRLLGENKIIGVSTHNVKEAVEAQNAGADYLGVGAAFPTGSKDDVNIIDHAVYKQITEAVDIPVTAIGGINENNILELSGSGIDGVAVISAIFAKENVYEAAKRLRALSERMVKGSD